MTKSKLTILLALLMSMVASVALAQTVVEIDGLYYRLNEGMAEAEVTSGYDDYSGDVTIPESVTYNSKTYWVTSIGEYAFLNCTGLTSINIPSSVTSIGYMAFSGCTGLSSITIPYWVTSIGGYAFYGCTGLSSVTIPYSVTSIGISAFQGCSGLTSVTIPYSVTSIGYSAFSGCSGLTTISVETGNPVYDSRNNCNAIIETATNTLVAGCQNTIIPNSVTSIGNYAFYECTGLTSITIPNSVTNIGGGAFEDCTGLTDVTINEGVTSIGWGTFSGCTGLTSIEIPNSVTSIGNYAFQGCNGLEQITVASGNTTYDSRDNCNAIIETASNTLVAGCKNTVIPNSVTSIGREAFSSCSNLTSLTIPSSVTSIGEGAFEGCKIHQLLSKCTTPPHLEEAAFGNPTRYHSTLYVPMGCWDAYAYDEDEEWCRFINIRETAIEEEEVKEDMAYTLMNTKSFLYAIYDNVNEGSLKAPSAQVSESNVNAAVRMVPSTQVDESNPYHCWQAVEIDGKQYLYNIGAKLFAVPATDGSAFTLSETVGSISMETGEDGIVIGGKTDFAWALVTNEYMPAKQGIDEIITAVTDINTSASESQSIYDLNGRKLTQKQNGVNIIRMSDGTVKRVMVK